jgi:hypothetical protein
MAYRNNEVPSKFEEKYGSDHKCGVTEKRRKTYNGNEVYYYAVTKFKKINKNKKRLASEDYRPPEIIDSSILTKSTTTR